MVFLVEFSVNFGELASVNRVLRLYEGVQVAFRVELEDLLPVVDQVAHHHEHRNLRFIDVAEDGVDHCQEALPGEDGRE